jgi:hypothetical protein
MKTKHKHIIIDPKEGIFLGTVKDEDAPFITRQLGDKRLIALFSNNNLLDITKAVGFVDPEDAFDYLHKFILPSYPHAFIGSVADDSKGPYVDTVSIVKAGYGEYAWDMIDALPMVSQVDH